MRGGLAQVNIIGSVIFSGMSGTAIADAAGIGTIEIKAMKDHGYPIEVAVGVTAASATLGPIIPPSLPFVIYGMMANVSIGSLFLGGILPGVLIDPADDGHGLDLRADLSLGLRCAFRVAQDRGGDGRDPRRVSFRSWCSGWKRPRVTECGDLHCARRGADAGLPLQVLGRDGADDAGDPHRWHDAGLVHADGGCGRGGDVVAVLGLVATGP